MRITRVVKSESGAGSFATIDDPAEVIKLAGRRTARRGRAVRCRRRPRRGARRRHPAGHRCRPRGDARRRHPAHARLQDHHARHPAAGSLGSARGAARRHRDRVRLGLPGYERLVEAVEDYAFDRGRREQILALEAVRAQLDEGSAALAEVDRLLAEVRAERDAHPYAFDRRFLFRVLSMGHSSSPS
ncbi:MAG: hypothetical protein R2734_16980 [Nocardioides sp.]